MPLAIAKGLRRRGVDIFTVQADGRRGDSDTALLYRALELRRVMFSQDEDFPIEAARRQTATIDFAG